MAVASNPGVVGTASRNPKPLISVVIPTRDSSATLPRLLQSIGAQGYHQHEVIVVDNASKDATSHIAREYGCLILRSGPERSAQRNAGAQAARGDFLLFVDADMELAPSLLESCIRVGKSVDGICIRETTIGDDYWARVRSFERSRYFRTNLFEAARGFWGDVFDRLGGYDTALTGLEDYDLHARFVGLGFSLGWVETPLLHHEEGLTFRSYIEKRRYYARTDHLYAAKHPDRWREQRSLMRRAAPFLRKPPRPSEWPLIPGFVAMRGVEWLRRT